MLRIGYPHQVRGGEGKSENELPYQESSITSGLGNDVQWMDESIAKDDSSSSRITSGEKLKREKGLTTGLNDINGHSIESSD